MRFSIDIDNKKIAKDIERRIERGIGNAQDEIARGIKREAKGHIRREQAIFRHELIEGFVDAELNFGGQYRISVRNVSDHAPAQEYGVSGVENQRDTPLSFDGKMPPVEALIPWVRAHLTGTGFDPGWNPQDGDGGSGTGSSGGNSGGSGGEDRVTDTYSTTNHSRLMGDDDLLFGTEDVYYHKDDPIDDIDQSEPGRISAVPDDSDSYGLTVPYHGDTYDTDEIEIEVAYGEITDYPGRGANPKFVSEGDVVYVGKENKFGKVLRADDEGLNVSFEKGDSIGEALVYQQVEIADRESLTDEDLLHYEDQHQDKWLGAEDLLVDTQVSFRNDEYPDETNGRIVNVSMEADYEISVDNTNDTTHVYYDELTDWDGRGADPSEIAPNNIVYGFNNKFGKVLEADREGDVFRVLFEDGSRESLSANDFDLADENDLVLDRAETFDFSEYDGSNFNSQMTADPLLLARGQTVWMKQEERFAVIEEIENPDTPSHIRVSVTGDPRGEFPRTYTYDNNDDSSRGTDSFVVPENQFNRNITVAKQNLATKARDEFLSAWNDVRDDSAFKFHPDGLAYINHLAEDDDKDFKPELIETLADRAAELNQNAAPSLGAPAPLEELRDLADYVQDRKTNPVENPYDSSDFDPLLGKGDLERGDRLTWKVSYKDSESEGLVTRVKSDSASDDYTVETDKGSVDDITVDEIIEYEGQGLNGSLAEEGSIVYVGEKDAFGYISLHQFDSIGDEQGHVRFFDDYRAEFYQDYEMVFASSDEVKPIQGNIADYDGVDASPLNVATGEVVYAGGNDEYGVIDSVTTGSDGVIDGAVINYVGSSDSDELPLAEFEVVPEDQDPVLLDDDNKYVPGVNFKKRGLDEELDLTETHPFQQLVIFDKENRKYRRAEIIKYKGSDDEQFRVQFHDDQASVDLLTDNSRNQFKVVGTRFWDANTKSEKKDLMRREFNDNINKESLNKHFSKSKEETPNKYRLEWIRDHWIEDLWDNYADDYTLKESIRSYQHTAQIDPANSPNDYLAYISHQTGDANQNSGGFHSKQVLDNQFSSSESEYVGTLRHETMHVFHGTKGYKRDWRAIPKEHNYKELIETADLQPNGDNNNVQYDGSDQITVDNAISLMMRDDDGNDGVVGGTDWLPDAHDAADKSHTRGIQNYNPDFNTNKADRTKRLMEAANRAFWLQLVRGNHKSKNYTNGIKNTDNFWVERIYSGKDAQETLATLQKVMTYEQYESWEAEDKMKQLDLHYPWLIEAWLGKFDPGPDQERALEKLGYDV